MNENNNFDDIIKGRICPYCNCETILVSDKEIYGPNSNFGGMYYKCILNNDHYVGTYGDKKTSLGRLADKELRQWKMKGHNTFDPLWKTKKYFKNQRVAYYWLSRKMELPIEYTHFGMFTIDQCKQAIDLLNERIEKGTTEI